jgi:ubiquinone/menaquinone biosynthesis C-methylase UbiE
MEPRDATMAAADAAYPADSKLRERHRLAYRWTPPRRRALLDAGCSWGDSTHWYAAKAERISGIDVNADAVAVARRRYPEIDFRTGPLEELPFDTGAFDAVVCCDVLEHVTDELAALNELYRVMAPGGTLVLSTPNKGLFGFMDPVNYPQRVAPLIERFAPALYRRLPGTATGSTPWWAQEEHHRHYSRDDLLAVLDRSRFRGSYRVTRTFRSGLLLYPLALNVSGYLRMVLGERVAGLLERPFMVLGGLDYWIPYGSLSYNVAIRLVKTA